MSERFSEKDLIDGLKSEKDDIIKYVYNTYQSRAYKVVLNNSGSEEDAETIFHDALIALIENIRANKFKGDSLLGTYLTGIIKFKWLAELKKRKTDLSKWKDTYPNMGIYQEDEENETISQNFEKLEKCFEHLKEDCKKLLIGYYYKKKKLKNIAVEMEYTESFVRIKKLRCLKALKNIIEAK